MSLPIFSAGRIEADVREAWSFLREAILIDSQSRRRVGREVRQTLVNLKASDDRLAELQVGLAAAREALRQAEASYSAGLGTNLERVTAQEVLLQAELATATQTIEQQAIRLALLRAVGVLRETLIDEPSGMPQQTLIVQPNG